MLGPAHPQQRNISGIHQMPDVEREHERLKHVVTIKVTFQYGARRALKDMVGRAITGTHTHKHTF